MRTDLKTDLREYGGAVMTHWSAILLGAASIVILVIQTIGDALDVKLWPWWANVILFAAAAHWGQFLAWRDAKRERDALRKYDINQSTLERLAEYRQQLISLQNESLQTDMDVGGWIERYKKLREDIIEFLKGNVSPAESSLFARLGLVTTRNVQKPPPVNADHVHWRSRCIRDWLWIEECTKDYGRRRLRKSENELAVGDA